MAGGQTALSPSVAERLVNQVRNPQAGELNPRALEILRLAAAETIHRETARRLFISEATVKTHLLHIYEKLGAPDRAAAVSKASQR